jgi:hypothetical protein
VRGGELRGKEQYRRRSAKAALRVCFALINNRLIGCLHHCLATGQTYQETSAFPHPQTQQNAAA